MQLTQSFLKEMLSYDPETGLFTWRAKPSQCTAIGTIAGTIQKNGYIAIKIKGKKYKAHRLVWFYAHGSWPVSQIDHINGVKNDNRLNNLREASNQQNCMNQGVSKKNSSGYRGISFNKKSGKWQAYIRVNRQFIHLGFHSDVEAAIDARNKAEIQYFAEFSPQKSRLQPTRQSQYRSD